MNTSENGLKIMHAYEDCILFAYPDPASPLAKQLQRDGVWARALRDRSLMMSSCNRYPNLSGAPWTIGWGNTGPAVKMGVVWTQDQADGVYHDRLTNEFEPAVTRLLKVETKQWEFDAMVSLAYNIGYGEKDFARSSVLRYHNAGNRQAASKSFLMWIKSGGVDTLGLYRRRSTEGMYYTGNKSVDDAIREGKAVPALP